MANMKAAAASPGRVGEHDSLISFDERLYELSSREEQQFPHAYYVGSSKQLNDHCLILTFFGLPLPMLPGLAPCISAIMSLKRSSLTPPPLTAAECIGRIEFIFQPRGMAGGGSGSVVGGMSASRNRSGVRSVAGFAFKCAATLLYRSCSTEGVRLGDFFSAIDQ